MNSDGIRIFPRRLQIGDLEGFTKEKDIFNRSQIGRGLSNVVLRVTDPLVIAVDNEWGTGKTTFLRMWAGELRKIEVPVVYFDAFEHDYDDDAFTALASEIIAIAQEKQKHDDPAAQRFLQSSIRAAKILLRSSLKVGVKLGTAGVLDAAELGNIASDISKEASELEDQYLGELLTKQKQKKQTIEAFREALATLPILLTPSTPTQTLEIPMTKPLVIIIDELDRCRPTFALQILERIKHFFSVPSVHFILGTHLRQLQNSVSAVYGTNIDSAKYLQKFIHLTLHLVDDNFRPNQSTSQKFIRHIANEIGLHSSYFQTHLQHLANQKGLSLREIEQIAGTLTIALAMRGKEEVYCPERLLVVLCALKILRPDLYIKAKSGQALGPESLDAVGLEAALNGKESMKNAAMEWRYFTEPEIAEDNPDYKGIGERLWNYNTDRLDVIPTIIHCVIDRFSSELQ